VESSIRSQAGCRTTDVTSSPESFVHASPGSFPLVFDATFFNRGYERVWFSPIEPEDEARRQYFGEVEAARPHRSQTSGWVLGGATTPRHRQATRCQRRSGWLRRLRGDSGCPWLVQKLKGVTTLIPRRTSRTRFSTCSFFGLPSSESALGSRYARYGPTPSTVRPLGSSRYTCEEVGPWDDDKGPRRGCVSRRRGQVHSCSSSLIR
jgi:hypothetical protein